MCACASVHQSNYLGKIYSRLADQVVTHQDFQDSCSFKIHVHSFFVLVSWQAYNYDVFEFIHFYIIKKCILEMG